MLCSILCAYAAGEPYARLYSLSMIAKLEIAQVIKDLGKRHVTYGVASHHVPVMKQVVFQMRYARLVPPFSDTENGLQTDVQSALSK
jgi:hypothetical protein